LENFDFGLVVEWRMRGPDSCCVMVFGYVDEEEEKEDEGSWK